jgi:hypothetical protein
LVDLGRFDLRQELALLHSVAEIDQELLQISAGAGVDRRLDLRAGGAREAEGRPGRCPDRSDHLRLGHPVELLLGLLAQLLVLAEPREVAEQEGPAQEQDEEQQPHDPRPRGPRGSGRALGDPSPDAFRLDRRRGLDVLGGNHSGISCAGAGGFRRSRL